MAMGDAQPVVNFEQSLTELESVVKQLESGEQPLEESLALFERGVALSEVCRKQLEAAEARIEILVKRAAGVKAEPFDSGND
ncbi:MAG: exodeoxyribonuclease VII small subunit [Acidobacteria bacterium]|nr:exodeoxyribonuclease VII small subunit [Acidobacteriota bacterium]